MVHLHAFDRRVCFLFVCLCLVAFSGEAQAGLKIYFIRHAEYGHNVVAEWRNVPRDQWPAYVGNGNLITPKGEAQLGPATEKLKQHHYDFIAVSPYLRTRHTVLPYLKATGARGEIWALGLRNPFTFAIEPRTGKIHVNDVGQNAWEEVDWLPAGSIAGANLGWNSFEGTHPFLEYPRIIGHELSGRVLDPGDSGLIMGEGVVINPYLNCGHCPACRSGSPRVAVCGGCSGRSNRSIRRPNPSPRHSSFPCGASG